ncbi:cytochrome c-552 like protein [Thioalkalivibrio denitrificans]|uniref:Cytochrome c-552 like protein n=1 Tax=Thioalkalivibrio denitrificans TaxID=108003 RepID=A0A1V3NNP9_9GAMM|nr:cytochrome c [Thioalkalivibrio denitrificans]OOG26442.1 cytochrome c-552 like protein [Thioalkalivibrio denitrificans]
MFKRRHLSLWLLIPTLVTGWLVASSAPSGTLIPTAQADEMSPKQLFEVHCAACHSITLPKSQRLARHDWEWVMDDMEDYGMTWLTDEQREKIIDHLVEHYGRDAPR